MEVGALIVNTLLVIVGLVQIWQNRKPKPPREVRKKGKHRR